MCRILRTREKIFHVPPEHLRKLTATSEPATAKKDSAHHRGAREPESITDLPLRARLFALWGERPGLVVALCIVSFIAGVCESAVLAILASVAAAVVAGHHMVAFHLGIHLHSTVNVLLLVGFVISILRLLVQVGISHLPSRIAADAQAKMRNDLFAAFVDAPWAVQSKELEGRFQELATSQVIQATSTVMNGVGILASGIPLAVLIAAALTVDFVAALVVIGTGALLFLLFRPLTELGRKQARLLSRAQLAYAGAVHDAVSVAEETQVFGVSKPQERRIVVRANVARHRFFTTQFLTRMISGSFQNLVYVLLVAGVWILVETGDSRVTALGAVVLLLLRASNYGQGVQSCLVGLGMSYPFLDRLREAEKSYSEVKVVRGTETLAPRPDLRFEHVTFGYDPAVPVLKDVSFEITPGESIGVVGPTGAGKSTLVQLLLGLREPTGGRYLVGGRSAQQLSAKSWSSTFAYVSQEPRLIQGTVADNIRFLRDVSDEEVVRAARLAHIHDEVVSWPQGYETRVSQRTRAVSGGQRQRICLARALAAHPSILILDEPTSALDPRSESLIQESLEGLRGELTLIIVAHRLSTLGLCDRVMVVEDGRLAAFAPADELERSNAFYKRAASLAGVGKARASQ